MEENLSELPHPATDGYGWAAVLRNTLPYLVLIAVAPVLHGISPAAPWLLVPFMGLFIYRITIVMHDCSHGTLFRDAPQNRRIGRFLGALTGIDIHSFTEQHRLHHRIYGRPGDPQGFHYLNLRGMSRAAFRWHLIKALLGRNLGHVFQESLLHRRNLYAAFRRGSLPLIVLVQLAVALVVTGAGAYPELILLPIVAAVTFGLFFSQLRGIAEHATITSPEDGHVRSHETHWADRLLLYDLNFNYHTEHHLHPQHPSRDLPALHRSLAAQHSPVSRSMFRTIAALYASLR